MKTIIAVILAACLFAGCAASRQPVPSQDLYIFAPGCSPWVRIEKGLCSKKKGNCTFEAYQEFWRRHGYKATKDGKLIPLKDI